MAEHFVIVGAQRSGTTHLYRMLEQHPDICMARPMRPEPKFFLDVGAEKAGYETYLSRYFAHRNGERMLGEKSTSYIERDDAIERLHSMLPQARLVFVLRNPVWRAYSNWRFSRAHGLETLDFEAALDAEKERLRTISDYDTSVSPFAYAARGHYVRYLDRWARTFPREHFIIVLSECLFAGHDAVRRVFERLSLDPDVPLHGLGAVNASGFGSRKPPSAATERLHVHFAPSVRALREQWQVDVTPWT